MDITKHHSLKSQSAFIRVLRLTQTKIQRRVLERKLISNMISIVEIKKKNHPSITVKHNHPRSIKNKRHLLRAQDIAKKNREKRPRKKPKVLP